MEMRETQTKGAEHAARHESLDRCGYLSRSQYAALDALAAQARKAPTNAGAMAYSTRYHAACDAALTFWEECNRSND